jgi:hypothetical protein
LGIIGNASLQGQAVDIGTSLGFDVRRFSLAGASSDHASFINAGIPAVFLYRLNDPLLHTPQDISPRVRPISWSKPRSWASPFWADSRPPAAKLLPVGPVVTILTDAQTIRGAASGRPDGRDALGRLSLRWRRRHHLGPEAELHPHGDASGDLARTDVVGETQAGAG